MRPVLVLFFILFFSLAFSSDDSVTVDFSGQRNKKGVPSPWELKEKSGKADFEIITDEKETVLHMKSNESSFSFQRGLKLHAKEYPYATWIWKAVSIPPGGDLRKSSRNDQALQVMVAFEDKKILSYVWDSNAPEGTVTEESVPWPISLTIKVVVVKSGGAGIGKWVTVTRNIYEDYKTLFGEEPAMIDGVRVQTNTQHTEGYAEGFFKKIMFTKRPG